MATVYEVLVKYQNGVKGRELNALKDSTSPSNPRAYSGSQRGVDHNRYSRAINPLLNQLTGGYYEKALRGGRAIRGISETYKVGGASEAFKSVGSIVILAMIIKGVTDLIKKEQQYAKNDNNANYMKLMTGQTVLSQNYSVTSNFITGRKTYHNQT